MFFFFNGLFFFLTSLWIMATLVFWAEQPDIFSGQCNQKNKDFFMLQTVLAFRGSYFGS